MRKKCKYCGQAFIAKRRSREFCDDACSLAYRRGIERELKRNEWHSPTEIVEAARTVMGGIDLDPASCARANEIVKAEKFYSVSDDGLKKPWFGRIWLNPPYGRFAPAFVERFGEFLSTGSIEQGVLLLATHHLTTGWIGSVFSHKPIICFPRKRLQFSNSTIHPAHGSVILGVGVNKRQFTEIFSDFGQLFETNGDHR